MGLFGRSSNIGNVATQIEPMFDPDEAMFVNSPDADPLPHAVRRKLVSVWAPGLYPGMPLDRYAAGANEVASDWRDKFAGRHNADFSVEG